MFTHHLTYLPFVGMATQIS